MTFDDPASNLACDEALLEMVEIGNGDDGILRFWQPNNYFVVLGHSNRLAFEVDIAACAEANIPILRRMSGGGTVLQGRGCLNYSLILDCEVHGIKSITTAFTYILDRHRQQIANLIGAEVLLQGGSDLTVIGRKFSGNAQYRKSRAVLVHGTFLLNFDLAMIGRSLRVPAKQPEYRLNRSHQDFVINLNVAAQPVIEALTNAWCAVTSLEGLSRARIESLVQSRYGSENWTKKF